MRQRALSAGAEYISAWDIFCNEDGCLARVGKDEKFLSAFDYVIFPSPALNSLQMRLALACPVRSTSLARRANCTKAKSHGLKKSSVPNYVRPAPKRPSATTVDVMAQSPTSTSKIKFVVDTGAHQVLTQANAERD